MRDAAFAEIVADLAGNIGLVAGEDGGADGGQLVAHIGGEALPDAFAQRLHEKQGRAFFRLRHLKAVPRESGQPYAVGQRVVKETGAQPGGKR